MARIYITLSKILVKEEKSVFSIKRERGRELRVFPKIIKYKKEV